MPMSPIPAPAKQITQAAARRTVDRHRLVIRIPREKPLSHLIVRQSSPEQEEFVNPSEGAFAEIVSGPHSSETSRPSIGQFRRIDLQKVRPSSFRKAGRSSDRPQPVDGTFCLSNHKTKWNKIFESAKARAKRQAKEIATGIHGLQHLQGVAILRH